MKIKTTTIGAYPKPSCTPIGDWFPDADDEGGVKSSIKSGMATYLLSRYQDNSPMLFWYATVVKSSTIDTLGLQEF